MTRPEKDDAEPLESELWRRWAVDEDLTAREQLVERYLWLSRVIALKAFRRYRADEVDVRDLIQCATVGLLEAVDRYDPDSRASFATYATARIRGAVQETLTGYNERLSQSEFRRRTRKERVASIRSVRKRRKARSAVFEEMVDLAVGLAIGYMLEDTALAPVDDSNRTNDPDAYQALENQVLHEQFRHIVDNLPRREAQVIRYHYYHEMEFVRIAELLDVSKARVSQIHSQGLKIIREALKSIGSLDVSG